MAIRLNVKKSSFFMVLAGIAVSAILGIVFHAKDVHTITLTEAQVQQRINAHLPIEKGPIKIHGIAVELRTYASRLTVMGSGTYLTKRFTVSGMAAGNIEFNPAEGAFYFHPSSIEITQLSTPDANNISEKVQEFIGKWIDGKKINANKELIGDAVEDWVKTGMTETAITALKVTPVYTLPDNIKGNFIRASLQSVEIGEGTVQIHISYWGITLKLLTYLAILALIIALVIAVILEPNILFLFAAF